MRGAGKRKTRRKACIYCGLKPAGSIDHVPPQVFFRHLQGVEIPYVPACEPCNNGFSKHDTYVADILAIEDVVSEVPENAALVKKALSAILRPESDKYRQMLLSRSREVELVTPTGISIGTGAAMKKDMARVRTVIGRIAKAFYYIKLGKPIPAGFEPHVLVGNELPIEEWERLAADFGSKPGDSVGGNTFLIKGMALNGIPGGVMVVMRFYGIQDFAVQISGAQGSPVAAIDPV